MSDYQDDTEISLGAGKLIFLFFGLVVLCGAFFGVGYMIGKNSGTPLTPTTDQTASTATPGAEKPSSAIPGSAPQGQTQDCAAGGNCGQTASNPEMTFYKNVEQKDVNPQLEQPSTPAPAPEQRSQEKRQPEPKTNPQQNPHPAPSAVTASGYVVQVAAVSKQQDANTLVNALRRKQYPVFVTSNPPSDRLFHVQAGPFSDLKEAEAVKTRLVNDGYSPILKR